MTDLPTSPPNAISWLITYRGGVIVSACYCNTLFFDPELCFDAIADLCWSILRYNVYLICITVATYAFIFDADSDSIDPSLCFCVTGLFSIFTIG